jgi:hypothetical protein
LYCSYFKLEVSEVLKNYIGKRIRIKYWSIVARESQKVKEILVYLKNDFGSTQNDGFTHLIGLLSL